MNVKVEVARLFAISVMHYMSLSEDDRERLTKMCKIALDPSKSDLERKVALQTIDYFL